jgi:hypothetical protein
VSSSPDDDAADVYPMPDTGEDPRFTPGLIVDVANVLIAHGYPRPATGSDYAGLHPGHVPVPLLRLTPVITVLVGLGGFLLGVVVGAVVGIKVHRSGPHAIEVGIRGGEPRSPPGPYRKLATPPCREQVPEWC